MYQERKRSGDERGEGGEKEEPPPLYEHKGAAAGTPRAPLLQRGGRCVVVLLARWCAPAAAVVFV